MPSLNPDLPANPLASSRFLPWLLLLFAGSGCAALIYEIVWLQLLQLVIGSSGISLGVLLGTFMGGLCLGSLMFPRLIPPRFHPLQVYGLLELGTGAIGVAVLSGMPYIAGIYTTFPGHGVLVRALVAAVCLIPPTLLMGATLPAIARWVETTREGISWLGFFYGGNIAGAVFGSLLAGFYLLRVYDMPTATYVAAGINAAVALFALVLASLTPEQVPSASRNSVCYEHKPAVRAIYLVTALSGLCALGAEVVWTRLLSLMLGATVYTFSIILAMFLIGLGIGSSAGAFMARTARHPRAALGACQMLVAGAAAYAALMIARSIPYWPLELQLSTAPWAPWHNFLLDILRSACAVLPAALLWGASFPLALAAAAAPGQDPARLSGSVYAANTAGAIAGSLAFSMLVIPRIGTQWAQRLLILLSAASALVALAPLLVTGRNTESGGGLPPGRRFLPARPALLLFSLVILGCLAAGVSQVPWVMVAFGRFSAKWAPEAVPGIVPEADVPVDGQSETSMYCTYVGEGMNVSVAVTKSNTGYRYFHGAGKVQASSDPLDMRLQRMLGHLSVLARSNPDDVKDVLVVACGAGVTAGSFVTYPGIRRIVICDIEPLVPKVVTPMFGRENYHVADGIDRENPHRVRGKEVRVVYDDGRHYIRTLPPEEKFDIITSDPIDPWVKGCAALNTVEYYRMCRDHLRPGGIMSLWIPFYESTPETVKSVVGTFFEVFPDGIIFSNDINRAANDAVLLGQFGPARIDVDDLEQRLERDNYRWVRESLVEVGFGTAGNGTDEGGDIPSVACDLLSTYAGQASDLRDWTKDAQINNDRNLRLQYLAGMWLNAYVADQVLSEILKYYKFPDQLFVGSDRSIAVLKQALKRAGR